MSHGRAFASGWHDLWHLCQFYNCSRHTYLPVATPAEGATPRAFAAAVRDEMAHVSGATKVEVDYCDVQMHAHARSLGIPPPDFLCTDAMAACGGSLHSVLEGMTRFAAGTGRGAAKSDPSAFASLVPEESEDCDTSANDGLVESSGPSLRHFLVAWGRGQQPEKCH